MRYVSVKASQAASRSKRTRHPSAIAMLTRASSEKRETLPRSRSFIRGWVTPQWLAASACVQPCCFTRAAIFCISSARDLRFAACSGVSAIASQMLAYFRLFSYRSSGQPAVFTISGRIYKEIFLLCRVVTLVTDANFPNGWRRAHRLKPVPPRSQRLCGVSVSSKEMLVLDTNLS
jgi:hypothetical protein